MQVSLFTHSVLNCLRYSIAWNSCSFYITAISCLFTINHPQGSILFFFSQSMLVELKWIKQAHPIWSICVNYTILFNSDLQSCFHLSVSQMKHVISIMKPTLMPFILTYGITKLPRLTITALNSPLCLQLFFCQSLPHDIIRIYFLNQDA